jgi:hypothetical protein
MDQLHLVRGVEALETALGIAAGCLVGGRRNGAGGQRGGEDDGSRGGSDAARVS